MYHFDRADNLQKEIGQQFTVSRGVPNLTLQSCTTRLKEVSKSNEFSGLIQWLHSFDSNSKYPVEALFKFWSLDFLSKNLFPIGVKMFQKFRVEITYEFIRRQCFPDKISRYEAIYITDTNFNDWIEYLKIVEQDPIIYKLTSEDIEAEKVDSMWSDKSYKSVHEEQEFARVCEHAFNYWDNQITSSPLMEWLCAGTFAVIDKQPYTNFIKKL